jgi:hypothetical protein
VEVLYILDRTVKAIEHLSDHATNTWSNPRSPTPCGICNMMTPLAMLTTLFANILWYVALLPGMTNRRFQASATTGVSSTRLSHKECASRAVAPSLQSSAYQSGAHDKQDRRTNICVGPDDLLVIVRALFNWTPSGRPIDKYDLTLTQIHRYRTLKRHSRGYVSKLEAARRFRGQFPKA